MAEIFLALTTLGSSIASGTAAAAGQVGLGTLLTTAGTLYSGVRAMQTGNQQASILQQKGEQELAIAQRKAMESRRQKDLVLSRQRAVAAASGGGATDPTVMSIMGQTEKQGEYNALMDMYNGRTMRADLFNEAASAKASGRDALIGSVISAGSGIYSGYSRKRSTAEYSS